MLTIYLIIIIVPLFLVASMGLQRQPSVLAYTMSALALGSAVLFMWAALPWDVVSIYWRWVVPVLFLAALVFAWRRIGTAAKQASKLATIFGLVINGGLIVFFAGLCWRVFLGYPAPANAIELSSPLQGGHFVVGHGGASPFINGHFKVRPQNYALDILGLNAWGARSDSITGEPELADYAIFGASIVAPCSGTVIATVDGLPDLPVGETDRENLAGNHVVLACLNSEIVLAHMQFGSVEVVASQQVETGDKLGLVGNSGNTSEPHLHIHAERGGDSGEILNGESVPMLIDGDFLVRGDLLGD